MLRPNAGIVTRVQAELGRRVDRDQRGESLGRAYVRQLAELQAARRACTEVIRHNPALGADAVAELEAERQRLSLAELELRTAVGAFRAQRRVLAARYSSAEAVSRISEAAAAVGDVMAEIGRVTQSALDTADRARGGLGRLDRGGAPARPVAGRAGPRAAGSFSPR
ncbi:MAG TPA: hypothetical protein VF781_03010 [Solirubrobacteraceae bacterium]